MDAKNFLWCLLEISQLAEDAYAVRGIRHDGEPTERVMSKDEIKSTYPEAVSADW